MELIKTTEKKKLLVKIIGKIDTNTSVEFRSEVAEKLDNVEELVLDFEQTAYCSSAGMRVLLACQKAMDGKGKMTIIHLQPEIKKLFKATGMLELLTIED